MEESNRRGENIRALLVNKYRGQGGKKIVRVGEKVIPRFIMKTYEQKTSDILKLNPPQKQITKTSSLGKRVKKPSTFLKHVAGGG